MGMNHNSQVIGLARELVDSQGACHWLITEETRC